MTIVIVGCGHEPLRRIPQHGSNVPRVPEAAAPSRRTAAERAAAVAAEQIGVPYLYGGASVRGFDCSGLVHFSYSRAGVDIPRTTELQWRQLTPVPGEDLRVGDLLFFRIEGKVSHVGLYLGDRRFVHAPKTGQNVTVADLESAFYREAFVRGARPGTLSD